MLDIPRGPSAGLLQNHHAPPHGSEHYDLGSPCPPCLWLGVHLLQDIHVLSHLTPSGYSLWVSGRADYRTGFMKLCWPFVSLGNKGWLYLMLPVDSLELN